jgi:hypothetical protein
VYVARYQLDTIGMKVWTRVEDLGEAPVFNVGLPFGSPNPTIKFPAKF